VAVGVALGVSVRVWVGLAVRVTVSVGVMVRVAVKVAVSVRVSVGVDVGVIDFVGVLVGVGVEVGVSLGVPQLSVMISEAWADSFQKVALLKTCTSVQLTVADTAMDASGLRPATQLGPASTARTVSQMVVPVKPAGSTLAKL
jgi:hypothetical protein